MDSVEQTGNYTQPQLFSFTGATTGNTYTKNFTVQNNQLQTVTVKIFTSEPAGTATTCPLNNTQIGAQSSSQANYAVANWQPGTYTWTLLATNNTVTPTPTPNPSATPSQTFYNVTVRVNGAGIQSINVTNMGKGSYLVASGNFPYTVQCSPGDTLRFEVAVMRTYTFNAYTFSDGTFPDNDPVYNRLVTGNFDITAEALLTP